nr:MAG TPA: hypothetical protein [Caudoviricetes sp.]
MGKVPCGICRKNGHAPADPVDVKIRTDFHTDFFLYKPVFSAEISFYKRIFQRLKSLQTLRNKGKARKHQCFRAFNQWWRRGESNPLKAP